MVYNKDMTRLNATFFLLCTFVATACSVAGELERLGTDGLFNPENLGRRIVAEGRVLEADSESSGSVRLGVFTRTSAFSVVAPSSSVSPEASLGAWVVVTGRLEAVCMPDGRSVSVRIAADGEGDGLGFVQDDPESAFALPISERVRDLRPLVPAHLRGVVTMIWSGSEWFMMRLESGDDVRISMRPKYRERLSGGDTVEVVGFMRPMETTCRLQSCIVRKVAAAKERPKALPMTCRELVAWWQNPSDDGRDLVFRPVVVEGRLTDVNRRWSFVQINIESEDSRVTASFPLDAGVHLPPDLVIGARVRVRGIVSGHYDEGVMLGELRPLVRPGLCIENIADIEVLDKAPFWTVHRLLGVILVIAAIAFMSIIYGIMLRRAVKRQTRRLEDSIRARVRERIANDATIRERLRLSRDLHDEFQQLLSGAQYLAGTALAALPANAALDEAANLLRKTTSSIAYAQSQLRVILWGLTQVSEGPASLVELLKYVVGRNTSWKDAVIVTSEGKEQPIVRSKAGELLMIMQEATGNAFNHGLAMTVRIHVSFGEKSLVMRVADDGTGFDTSAEVPPGHYGLASMRERADEIGGRLSIESKIGEGATMTVEVPYE